MVSRTPQQGEVEAEGSLSITTHVPSKTVVKETQRDGNGSGTPRQSKKEVHVPTKAEDVAELKDYVREPTLRLNDCELVD